MPFDLLVLYRWKPGVAPDRIDFHLKKIRAMNGQVPGLLDVRIGPRTLGFGPAAEGITHACVMSFAQQADYAAFGTSPIHDDIAPALVADLAELTAVGFTS
jgi:hypothetical protein